MNYRQRLFILMSLDSCIVVLSVVIVYFLRFEFLIVVEQLRLLLYTVFIHALFYLFYFYHFKLYRRVLQYASLGEGVKIVQAAILAEFSCMLADNTVGVIFLEENVPQSVYTSCALIILGVGGSRFAWRLFRDTYFVKKGRQEQHNVLIIGAGKAGVLIAKELLHSNGNYYNLVAFIDDSFRRHNLEVLGIPVVGGRDKIHSTVKDYRIDDIIIAMPSASKAELVKIIDICKNSKANVKILPRVEDIINGKVSVSMIRDVRVDDLLGREEVNMDIKEIASYLKEQVVLITGAGGSIGSEICRQILPFKPGKLLLLGHGENSIYEIERELRQAYPEANMASIIADIQDRKRIEEVFETYSPSVVFHAAAHKHVPLMEHNPVEAIKNNILGTKNVAESAHAFGASHFVMISTDKAVNPTSVMGATKRMAEMIVQGFNQISMTKFVAVRFGNVLGSRGSVIPIFKKQIQQGGPVTITHPDMVRYFMTIPEAVQLTIQAGALAKGGEIFVLDMGEPVKIVDMARDLISLSGLEPDKDIEIVFTGVRPGEKLYEELLTSDENMLATKHERILISKPDEIQCKDIQAKLARLENLISQYDTKIALTEIKSVLFNLLRENHGSVSK